MPADVVYDIMKTLWSAEGMAAMVAAKKTFKTMNMENAFDRRVGSPASRVP